MFVSVRESLETSAQNAPMNWLISMFLFSNFCARESTAHTIDFSQWISVISDAAFANQIVDCKAMGRAVAPALGANLRAMDCNRYWIGTVLHRRQKDAR
ncbi:hypothetical protein [Rhodoferax sp.]|uniref:hypothetical protein n=1 Tax=Rhodoferax sp. TaxID=50421 RepID=UPI00284BB09F|nr:hypothetical protein [Rhodoferax sp.]MDR3371021.1 hypothetical protein [Rhodoferax sp.]